MSSQAETDEPDDNILQGMHFLCAEDNELNAEILMELLKIEGAECTICENGEKRNDDRSNGHYSEIIRRKQSCQNTGHNQ